MKGLPMSWLQAVCAHELTHAWVAENVPPARKHELAREAEEGFCELVAYLYSASRNDEPEKAMILKNGYTRGQIDLYVAAESRYGFNDVLDWVRYGIDPKLSASDPARVHDIKAPDRKAAPSAAFTYVSIGPPPAATNLLLKAVFWDPKHPLALINDHTFGLREEAKVRLGTNNVVVRCVAISQNSVRVRVVGSAAEQDLFLK